MPFVRCNFGGELACRSQYVAVPVAPICRPGSVGRPRSWIGYQYVVLAPGALGKVTECHGSASLQTHCGGRPQLRFQSMSVSLWTACLPYVGRSGQTSNIAPRFRKHANKTSVHDADAGCSERGIGCPRVGRCPMAAGGGWEEGSTTTTRTVNKNTRTGNNNSSKHVRAYCELLPYLANACIRRRHVLQLA